jgi:hypothetical protein
MIYVRRRNDTALIEVDSLPRLRVLPEAAHSSVRRLSRIEDAQLYPTQQARNSEKDRPTPMKEPVLR